MQMINGFPRRGRLEYNVGAELAIRQAIATVEGMGAHQLLTDSSVLLQQALEKVADYVELDPEADKVAVIKSVASRVDKELRDMGDFLQSVGQNQEDTIFIYLAKAIPSTHRAFQVVKAIVPSAYRVVWQVTGEMSAGH
jgi:hypothetical protein